MREQKMSNRNVFVLEADYTIHYTNRDPIPIPEIIESLRSLEKIITRTPSFLEKAYLGVEISSVEVYVNQIESGSLIEKLTIKYIFKDEAAYNHAKKKFDEAIAATLQGANVNALTLIVAVVVGGLIVEGVHLATGGTAPTNHIDAKHSTIIQAGGDVNIDSKTFEKLLNEQVDKKELAKSAINIVKPAKLDSEAKINIDGYEALSLDRDFINQAPEEYIPPTPDTKHEEYTNALVVIYASDRDKSTSVWAGIVPEIISKRVKFILAESVDPTNLHGRTKVKANITVVSKFHKAKKMYEISEVIINKTD